jgi:hypothetical protein
MSKEQNNIVIQSEVDNEISTGSSVYAEVIDGINNYNIDDYVKLSYEDEFENQFEIMGFVKDKSSRFVKVRVSDLGFSYPDRTKFNKIELIAKINPSVIRRVDYLELENVNNSKV